MDSTPMQNAREQWHQWATNQIGGGQAQIDAATNAAMNVVAKGGSTDQAVAAARASVPPGMAASSAPTVDVQSHSAGRPGTFRGVVLNIQQRFESATVIVWDLRVAQHDAVGNVTATVPVEIRARTLNGSINTGDLVEIEGAWQPGQVLHPASILDLTNGVTFSFRKPEPKGRVVLVVVIALIIVALALWVNAYTAFHIFPKR